MEGQVVDRLGEGANVDPFGHQRATHNNQDHVYDRPETPPIFGRQVSELVDMPLGLEHDVAADEEIDAVVGDPVVILVDLPAWRGAPASRHIADEAVGW